MPSVTTVCRLHNGSQLGGAAPLDYASSGYVDVVAALLEEEHSARDSRDDSVADGALRRCERAELSLLV